MGQAILYCYRCSTQLRDSHFEQGKAFRIDARVCCSACAPEAIKSLPSHLVEQLLKQLSYQSPKAMSASSTASPVLRTATPRQAAPAVSASRARPPKGGNMALAIGIAVAVVVVGLAVVVFSSSSGDVAPERAPGPGKAAVKPGPGPGPSRETTPPPPGPDSPAGQALENARKFAREHPDDLFGQLRAFEDLTLQADQGPAGTEARKEVQSLRQRSKEAIARTLAAVNQEIAGPLAREEFGAAFDALEASKARLEWPEWKLEVDHRIGEVRAAMDAVYAPLKAKALQAKSKGDTAAVEAVVAQVRKWGSSRLAGDLTDVLAGVYGPPVRLPFQDFEKDMAGWGFVGGQEFPGAKGLLEPDTTVVHGGRRAIKLQADFTGGGAYVGLWCDLQPFKERDVREIHLWVKTSTVARVGIRLADASDQCHQKNGGVALSPSTDWQELVLKISDLVGGEHWSGANDGRLHGPVKGFGVNLGKDTFRVAGSKQGTLWIDDVDLVVVPGSSGRDQ